jgi:recombination protein RecT
MSSQPAEKPANLPAEIDYRKPVKDPNNLRALLDRAKSQIAVALPKHLTVERMVRVACTAIQKNPDLLECSQLSIIGSVIQAAELGLELSGALGHAYLVPFWNKHTKSKEAQFQVGYRGLIALAFRSNQVAYFNAHEVRENDRFEFEYGTDQFLRHVPARGERGDVTYLYSVFRTKDGGSDFEVMTAEEVEAHRKRYSKQTSDYSPWVTARTEMEKKTPLRRLAKRCPMSIELQIAASIDEHNELAMTGAIDAVPAQLPLGRVDLRAAANGAGELAAAQAAQQAAQQAEQSGEPAAAGAPSAEDLEREEAIDNACTAIDKILAEATSAGDVGAAEAELLRHRQLIGEDRYQLRADRCKQLRQELGGAAASNKKSPAKRPLF